MTLTVEDDGPGLPPDRCERRAQARRSGWTRHAPGSGLGLSIVDELARAYGGSVTLGASPLGGLRVTLVLPRSEG